MDYVAFTLMAQEPPAKHEIYINAISVTSLVKNIR